MKISRKSFVKLKNELSPLKKSTPIKHDESERRSVDYETVWKTWKFGPIRPVIKRKFFGAKNVTEQAEENE